MSVIPLVIEGPNLTVVDHPTDFQNRVGITGRVVLTNPLDRGQLVANYDANVSYDLRVGKEYHHHRDLRRRDLRDDGVINLLPGSAVIIETEELVHFPSSMFGQIVPRVSLLQKGLSNTSSKVDPGYQGNLLVTIFNLGKRPYRIHHGERFCALYILKVGEGARPYAKFQQRMRDETPYGLRNKFMDWLERNTAGLMVLAIIVSLVLAIASFTFAVTTSR
jgi:deoxycytidine triphosphate deaminase